MRNPDRLYRCGGVRISSLTGHSRRDQQDMLNSHLDQIETLATLFLLAIKNGNSTPEVPVENALLGIYGHVAHARCFTN